MSKLFRLLRVAATVWGAYKAIDAVRRRTGGGGPQDGAGRYR